ncbi:MAG: hypothetical protein VB093_11530, partial [Propionicimonas sp.]|nr:hypothetical protein [Propionicimonas sp.]
DRAAAILQVSRFCTSMAVACSKRPLRAIDRQDHDITGHHRPAHPSFAPSSDQDCANRCGGQPAR